MFLLFGVSLGDPQTRGQKGKRVLLGDAECRYDRCPTPTGSCKGGKSNFFREMGQPPDSFLKLGLGFRFSLVFRVFIFGV